jgi:hypothetical protein
VRAVRVERVVVPGGTLAQRALRSSALMPCVQSEFQLSKLDSDMRALRVMAGRLAGSLAAGFNVDDAQVRSPTRTSKMSHRRLTARSLAPCRTQRCSGDGGGGSWAGAWWASWSELVV